MIFKIAWLNIWRSTTRSLVVILAIMVGVWAVIFLVSFMNGFMNTYIDNAIENEISHIQIHHPEFKKDRESKYYLPKADSIQAEISAMDNVKAASMRTLVNAMLSSSKGARGIQIQGVEPEAEAVVTNLRDKLKEGEFFTEGKQNQILIGRALAQKMNVKVRSKVVITFQDLDGDITAGAFRITGLFHAGNKAIDEGIAYVRQTDLNRLLDAENIGHEVAILLKDPQLLQQTTSKLERKFPDYLVETYKEISPEIELFNSQMHLTTTIFTVIVMLALIFGIINTMLMAVLERMKELGMLMAIGMNKVRVFFMVVLETILLGVISAPLGLLLGYFTVLYLNDTGLDLSAWAGGMEMFGMGGIVYPYLQSGTYVQVALAVFITAILASIYPAVKAIKLRPVEALQKI